ncbi:hypothetical protein EAMG_05372 [Escherichia coli M056]|uniref:hypothetical protein n=1 Tax=Escherichia coli TaxID=562 RepID=UPI000A18714F|nr:hypothetical protein [Escherichia coli]OSK27555.1 hypothetical protein EAMG_05372 [Escherichia coli M056]
MKTMACVASGPSLTPEDCLAVHQADIPIIAVNNSWLAAPYCSAIYAADCCWWESCHNVLPPSAERWCGDAFTARRFGIRCFSSALPGPFNSGQRAVELAIHFGASRILLLGYDCSLRYGTHWHGKHRFLANPDKFSVASWHDEFSRLKAVSEGVRIINCSRYTQLNCFPRQTLEMALSYQGTYDTKTNGLYSGHVRTG